MALQTLSVSGAAAFTVSQRLDLTKLNVHSATYSVAKNIKMLKIGNTNKLLIMFPTTGITYLQIVAIGATYVEGDVMFTASVASSDIAVIDDTTIAFVYSTDSKYPMTILETYKISGNNLVLDTSRTIGTGRLNSIVFSKENNIDNRLIVSDLGSHNNLIVTNKFYPIDYTKNVGIVQETKSAGQTGKVAFGGDISSVHTGLMPKSVYYINKLTGQVTEDPADGYMFAKALNDKQLFVGLNTQQLLFEDMI